MPKSSRNRRMRTRMSGGVGPVADLTVSYGDPIGTSCFTEAGQSFEDAPLLRLS